MKIEIKEINTKNAKKWIMLMFLIFSFANCGQAAIASDITTQKMIDLTNESRKSSGLLPLKINNKLTAAAEAKANDMFKFQYFDHNSPSGVTPWYWIKSAGYNYLYAGENLAIDFVTAEGTHLALMRSITHRDNILKPNYTEIGIAVKKGIFDGNESIIIVQQFGAPLKKIIKENNESKIVVRGDADISLRENKEEHKTEEIKVEEAKRELVEIKSPVVYFRDENIENDFDNKQEGSTALRDNGANDEQEENNKKVDDEEINKEFVLPIMFPVENIRPLNKTLTENIFWNNYQEKEERVFDKFISFFNYKFWLVKICASV